MNNLFNKTIKATIINVIVALLITLAIIIVGYLFFGAKIDETISIINKLSINSTNKEIEKLSKEERRKETTITTKSIENYPEYGTQYATIEISEINVKLPVYYGDTLEVLKNGVGHSSGSYFPGEGGSIVYMGHNSKNTFRNFSQLKNNNKIIIKTNYGEYHYKIYDMKLINETEIDKLPIQREKEILMIYTCYPFNNIGYASQRYVVYAELEE